MTSQSARAEAATWLARLHSDAPTPADKVACEAWLAASAANRRAMAEVNTVWESAGGLSGVSCALPPWPPERHEPRSPTRRRVLAGGTAAAAAAALGWWWSPASYATGIGETRKVALSDGSTMMLDVCTQVNVSLGRGLRRLDLIEGQLALTVAPIPDRPFIVAGGDQHVLCLGKVLQVSYRAGCFSAVAIDGLAVVQAPETDGLRIENGQRVLKRSGRPPVVDKPTLDVETAWQREHLVFVDDTLATAASQFNRYNLRRIELADPSFGQLRVSGIYDARAGDAFAHSVATLFNLSLAEQPDRIVLGSATPR